MAAKGKVLVVDDEEAILKLLKGLLEKAGYQVACATNTIGAGYLLKDFDPDVVILDIMLPGSLSGDQACEALRSFRPGVKILFYSGLPEDELKRLAHKHRADGCLSKGVRTSVIVETLRQLIPRPGAR
jgi:DNA-binding response OmpR family regulator